MFTTFLGNFQVSSTHKFLLETDRSPGTLGGLARLGATPHVAQSPGPEPYSRGPKPVWLSLAPALDARGLLGWRSADSRRAPWEGLSVPKCVHQCRDSDTELLSHVSCDS